MGVQRRLEPPETDSSDSASRWIRVGKTEITDPVLMANPLRIEGPDPPAMTCADVERWLVAAFMAFTGAGIFSVRSGRLQSNDPREMAATFDWIVFSADVLGLDSPERIALLTWARAKARRRIKRHRRLRLLKDVPGGTITDYCREFGIWRRTFDRRRKRACEHLAEAWNARAAGRP